MSKVFGFVRDRVFGYYFGTGDFADAWGAALRMPNVVQNLLGEGTLSASMIPVYSEMLEEGRDADAKRFAGAALGILIAVASGLVLAGILVAPVLVGLMFSGWGPEKQEITVVLVRILFPMTGVLVVSAWALGILNSHRRFFISYVAPVFWNVAQIAALVGGALWFGLDGRDARLVIALAWGALVGGVLQLAVQIPWLWGSLAGMKISLGRGVGGVGEAIRNFVPVVAARGVVNLSGWIDIALAGTFLTGGAVAVMRYAQTFYMLPIALFGMSVAASELPELSRMRADDAQVLAARVSAAVGKVSYFLIPSTLAYLALGDVVVAALFETGRFDSADTLITWAVLAAYSLSLPASASSRVLSSTFYALRDTRTPARIAYIRVAISVVVGAAMMFPLERFGFSFLRLGAAGLALGATAGAWTEYVLLRRSLGRAIGAHGPGAGPITRMALAAAFAAGVGVAVQLLVPPAHPVVVALETLVPFGVVYVTTAHLLGQRLPGRGKA